MRLEPSGQQTSAEAATRVTELGPHLGPQWRCAFTYDSIGVPCVLLYYLTCVLLRGYLLLYNALQTLGWAGVLCRLAAYVARGSVGAAWPAFGPSLLFWQNLAALEVLHAFFGLVRAP